MIMFAMRMLHVEVSHHKSPILYIHKNTAQTSQRADGSLVLGKGGVQVMLFSSVLSLAAMQSVLDLGRAVTTIGRAAFVFAACLKCRPLPFPFHMVRYLQ